MAESQTARVVKVEGNIPIFQVTTTEANKNHELAVPQIEPGPSVEVQSLSISIDEDHQEHTLEERDEELHHAEVQEEKEDVKDIKFTKRKSRGYSQRFRSAWKELPEFKGWLNEGNSPSKAYCTCCSQILISGKSELLRHAKSKKHLKKMSRISTDNSEFLEDNVIDDLELPLSSGDTVYCRQIDLRSDTVTRPSKAMKTAMYEAPVGDDVFQDDPTVAALERKVADLLKKEAALFVPSGTMANLIAVMAHCWGRGSEIIIGDESHLNLWAQGGIAQIGSIHHRTIKNLDDGTFSLAELRSLIRGIDPHWPITTLVCIENTHNMKGGRPLPISWLEELGKLCSELNLALHMDGARLMNAAVAQGTCPSSLVAMCHSVTMCLDKGLGAPMGSLVVGNRDFIDKANRLRKVLGGGLHQSGMMAAAGIYALDNVVSRFPQDHSFARAIALSVYEEHSSALTVDMKNINTNIGLLQCDNLRVTPKKLCERLQEVPEREFEELGERVIVLMLPVSDSVVRYMTHCNISKEDVKAVKMKLKFVVQEYDNMMFLSYKSDV